MTKGMTMERQLAAAKVRAALEHVLKRDLGDLPDSTRVFDDLHLDSTSVIELLIAIEDETGLEVDVDALDPEVFITVGAMVEFVASTAASPA
jgi:acyl carrier protein